MNIKKKFGIDLIFNIFATILPLMVLQVVAYPIIARQLSDENYGIMITIFSMLQLVCGTLGTGLNNVRLVKDSVYQNKNIKGDFNFILLISGLLTVIIMIIGTWYYEKTINLFSIILIIITGVCSLVNSYIQVEYRINLTFKKVLLSNIWSAVGYILGLGLFFVINKWELLFCCAQILSLIYNFHNTKILSETIKITELFKATLKDVIYVDISGLCMRAISYADKMLLLPLIGGEMVSIYYTSSLIGKIIVLGFNPVNSVILSYLNKRESVNKKTFKLYLLINICICVIGYFTCLLISRPLLEFLFPQWVEQAMVYVPITTLNLCIITLCNMLIPFTMKYCDMSWQFVIDFITLLFYIVVSLALLNKWSLLGFCFGITISYFIKLTIILFVYLKKKKI